MDVFFGLEDDRNVKVGDEKAKAGARQTGGTHYRAKVGMREMTGTLREIGGTLREMSGTFNKEDESERKAGFVFRITAFGCFEGYLGVDGGGRDIVGWKMTEAYTRFSLWKLLCGITNRLGSGAVCVRDSSGYPAAKGGW